jgi:putative ABC transport system permease protein
MFEDMGANAIYITSTGDKTGGSTTTLTLEDAEALAESPKITTVAVVAPTMSRPVRATYGNNSVNINLTGATPEIAKIQNYPVASGKFISELDVKRRTSVGVLGYQTALDLFEAENPIGKSLRITNRKFQVIGVIEELGGRPGTDDYIIIPLTTMQSKISTVTSARGHPVQRIAVQAISTEEIDKALTQVTTVLRQRHHIREGEEDDFNVTNMTEILGRMQESLATFSIFLASVGAIALIVGGIGIMNIMLVSVTERTREIGIRKAVGGRRIDILSQFLVESAVLSLSGGIIGLLIAFGGSALVGGIRLMRFPVEAQITPDIVIVAVSVSIGIGLISGTYPAFRAASLDPIESLRHE